MGEALGVGAAGSPMRHQVCTRTVMDTTDPDIVFDEAGVSNYWRGYQRFKAAQPDAEARQALLEDALARIRASGRGRRYDCILGLSGGVDSSYLACRAYEWGLRPLLVHFDNGWNSELAVNNIERLVAKHGFDLATHVMDWEDFRSLQRAYFKASVLDLEVPTDNMILGALYRMASRHGIKFILSGQNSATEWLLPKRWNFDKVDVVNIKAINDACGDRPLTKLPLVGVWSTAYFHYVRGIRSIALLDLTDFNQTEAKRFLAEDFGWRDYGGKHHESVFTRFYQGYVLPRKFGIDKRKAHLSNLILTGEMTREQALAELQKPPYDEELQRADKEYVAKKLGFSAAEFEAVLTQPNRSHEEFGTDRAQRDLYYRIADRLRPLKRLVQSAAGRRPPSEQAG